MRHCHAVSIRSSTWLCVVVLLAGCREKEKLTFEPLTVEEISATRALLRFTTNRPVKIEVELGRTEVLDQRFTDPEIVPGQLATEHRVPLENLFQNTKYLFRIKTTDEDKDIFYSAQQEFRTVVAPVSRLKNVALLEEGTSVVSVSSTQGGGDKNSTHGANRAIDGDFTTDWASNGDGDAARIELDLGQTRMLTAFGFRSRSRTDGSAITTRVALSLDGAAELEFDTPDPNQLSVFTLSAPVSARTAVVRAVTTSGGNTGAKELQLLMP